VALADLAPDGVEIVGGRNREEAARRDESLDGQGMTFLMAGCGV
jgi:hypothetical protein